MSIKTPNCVRIHVRDISKVPHKPFPCCSFLEWAVCGVMAAVPMNVLRIERNITLLTIRQTWSTGPYELRTRTAVLVLSFQYSSEMEDMLRIEVRSTTGREMPPAECFLFDEIERMASWLVSLGLCSDGRDELLALLREVTP